MLIEILKIKTRQQIAQRCLSFIHNTLSELQILEIQKPEGAVECWAFLCALEVLHACQLSMANSENNHDNQQVDRCSIHTASLWAVAKDKVFCSSKNGLQFSHPF